MTTPAYRWFTDGKLLWRITKETTWVFNRNGSGWQQTDIEPHFVELDYENEELSESTARELFPEAFEQESNQ